MKRLPLINLLLICCVLFIAATGAPITIGSAGGGSVAMVTGSEVDTGDTYDGATVYVKVINFGALPNSTTKNVAHSITSLAQVVGSHFIAKTGTPDYLPLSYAGSASPRVTVDNTNVTITTGSNLSSYTALVWVYYTRS